MGTIAIVRYCHNWPNIFETEEKLKSNKFNHDSSAKPKRLLNQNYFFDISQVLKILQSKSFKIK